MKTITPTQTLRTSNGRVEISLFGPPIDWSIKPLTNPKGWNSPVYKNINKAATGIGVKRLYAPLVSTFNAEIFGPANCPKRIIGANHENEDHPDNHEPAVEIFYDMPVDAVELTMGTSDGFWLSSADCVCLTAYHQPTGRLICAHAGFNSLCDSDNILLRKTRRRYESVVDAIAVRIGREAMRGETSFFMALSIGPGHFKKPWNDPERGADNREITNHIAEKWGNECIVGNIEGGSLDLRRIIRKQLRRHGVPDEKIDEDENDTYSARNGDGEYLWWSHERSKENRDGKELFRNGLIVKRSP